MARYAARAGYSRKETGRLELENADVIPWMLRKLGIYTLITLALLIGAVASVNWGLSHVVSGLNVGLASAAGLLAISFTWLLARSRLKGWLAWLILLLCGLVGLVIYFGGLWDLMLAFLRAYVAFTRQIWHWFRNGPPDPTLMIEAAQEIGFVLSLLVGQIDLWLYNLSHGIRAFDRLALNLTWSLVAWLLAAWATWSIRRRRNAILGLAPGGLLLAFGLNYVRGSALNLIPFIGATLLLMTLTRYLFDEERWKRENIDYPEGINFEQTLVAIFLAITVTGTAVLANAIPPITIQTLIEWTDRLRSGQSEQQEAIAESLGLEARITPPPEKKVVSATLPRQHLLGSGPELSRREVMRIRVQDPVAVQRAAGGEANQVWETMQYYWRGLTFDQYTGRGWATSLVQESRYRAEDTALYTLPSRHRRVIVNVDPVESLGGVIYVPGLLLTANKDFRTIQRPVSEWEDAPPFTRLQIETDFYAAMIDPGPYQATSMVPWVGQDTLRRTGDDYPRWVRSRYLSLPGNIPLRVFELAESLTKTALSPYEKALDLESYLRTITYTLDIPTPPVDRDVADYFLFDLKKGYCDYYATAMVVMARSIGLPARLVVGYVRGAYDLTNGEYVVSEADAHSWVEIYFPGTGWVEFEPTAGRPPIERPLNTPSTLPGAAETIPIRARLKIPSWAEWLQRGAVGAVFLAFLGSVWGMLQTWRLRHLPPRVGIARVYRRLYRRSRPITGPPLAGNTPLEFSASLQDRLVKLGGQEKPDFRLASAAQDVDHLTGLYTWAIYSPHLPSRKELNRAVNLWLGLRWPLRLAGFRVTLRALRVRLWRKFKPDGNR